MPVKYVVGTWEEKSGNTVHDKWLQEEMESYHKRINEALDSLKREADLQNGAPVIVGWSEVVNPDARQVKFMVVYQIAKQIPFPPGHQGMG